MQFNNYFNPEKLSLLIEELSKKYNINDIDVSDCINKALSECYGYERVVFNKDGSITVIGTRGPDKSLEAEARRIIEKLPKLIPGKQRGKPTPVTFAYPITFKLNT